MNDMNMEDISARIQKRTYPKWECWQDHDDETDKTLREFMTFKYTFNIPSAKLR